MSKIDNGGRAFPRAPTDIGGVNCGGMTLRDWFAGQALAGVMANDKTNGDDPHSVARAAAMFAYILADAMLRERSV